MNILAAVLLFCAMPLMLAVVAGVASGRARNTRQPRTSWLGASALVATLLLAPAFWIRWHGAPIQGILVGKTDSLTISDTGLTPSISRRFLLTIADPAAPLQFAHWPVVGDLQLEVDEQRFDALREGQRLAMHEWKQGPIKVARLDSMPWWILAPGLLDRLAYALGWGHQFDGRPIDTQATVVSVRTVRDAEAWSPFGRAPRSTVHVTLKQPYDEVRLQLHTPDGADVVSLDRIDSGTGGALTPGIVVPVTYPERHPRLAQLSTGTRSYSRRNALNYWGSELIVALVLVVVLSLVYGVRRRDR